MTDTDKLRKEYRDKTGSTWNMTHEWYSQWLEKQLLESRTKLKNNGDLGDVSLRDKLAMSALTGLISNNKYFDPSEGHKTMILEEYIFERAYSMADEMMKVRNGG